LTRQCSTHTLDVSALVEAFISDFNRQERQYVHRQRTAIQCSLGDPSVDLAQTLGFEALQQINLTANCSPSPDTRHTRSLVIFEWDDISDRLSDAWRDWVLVGEEPSIQQVCAQHNEADHIESVDFQVQRWPSVLVIAPRTTSNLGNLHKVDERLDMSKVAASAQDCP
jgi:hypothetical protein